MQSIYRMCAAMCAVALASTMASNASASTTQQTTGGLKITVAANWQGVTPDAKQRFEMCIAGPSAAAPNCKKANTQGGTLAWVALQPGTYSITQTALGPAWSTSPFSTTVDVTSDQVGAVTIANTFVDQFTCPVIDGFDRPNGALNPQWTGDTSNFAIINGVVSIANGGRMIWDGQATFGADQTACMTVLTVRPYAVRQSLVLKAQTVWEENKGLILVNYATDGRISVLTRQPGQPELVVRAEFAIALSRGDQLGARALRDGSVRVYKNGALIGMARAGAFFARRGGRIGVWYEHDDGAEFDNFGGATITP